MELVAKEEPAPLEGQVVHWAAVRVKALLAQRESLKLSCAEKRLAIRVNTIHPGFIETPLLRQGMARIKDPAEAERVYAALQPVGHLGTPEDIAYGALYLASDEAKFVTGAELVIDGGYTAR